MPISVMVSVIRYITWLTVELQYYQMKRRIRTDLESRDYHCPCGKAYLSYSALHTHIKKYHRDARNMLEKAVTPQRTAHRRGRPKDKNQHHPSEEFEELTLFETATLKIYEELVKVNDSDILLQGNEEQDAQSYNSDYLLLLQRESLNYCEVASEKDIRECEPLLRPVISGVTKHFNSEISARLRLMLAVGYLQFSFHSSPKQECLRRMSICSWQGVGGRVSEVLYDVMMQALQRRGHPELVLTSNEE